MKKQNINRNEDLVRKIFINMGALTRVNPMSSVEYTLRRIGGAFELKKIDTVTEAELSLYVFGELSESRTKARFAILQKRGNVLRTVARANCLVECLNKINNLIDEETVRFTLEDLARLGQI